MKEIFWEGSKVFLGGKGHPMGVLAGDADFRLTAKFRREMKGSIGFSIKFPFRPLQILVCEC